MVKDTLEKSAPHIEIPRFGILSAMCNILCLLLSVLQYDSYFLQRSSTSGSEEYRLHPGYSGFIIVVLEMLVVNFADKYLTIAKLFSMEF